MERLSIKGVIPPLPTPFDGAMGLDTGKAKKLSRVLLENKADALYVCGATGEVIPGLMGGLTIDERKTMLETVIYENGGQAKVIAHVGGTDQQSACILTRHAAAAGADAVASIPPIEGQKNLESTITYYKAIAESSPLGFLAYLRQDMRSLWKVGAEQFCETMNRQLGDKWIAVKYTDTDMTYFADLVKYVGGRVSLLTGEDSFYLEGLKLGSDGAIGTIINPLLPHFQHLLKLFSTGDLAGAYNFQKSANDLTDFMMTLSASIIPPVKSLLRLRGVDVGNPRPPLKPLSASQEASLADRITTTDLMLI